MSAGAAGPGDDRSPRESSPPSSPPSSGDREAHGATRLPATPSPRRLRTYVVLARRMVAEILEDRVLSLAAEAGFWAVLSLPPLLLGLLGVVGYAGDLLGPQTLTRVRETVLDGAGQFLTPQALHDVVEPLVDHVLTQGHGDVASVSFVVSLWSGSAAMRTYVRTITVAYDMRSVRSGWRTILLAFGVYLGALAIGVVLLPLLALGPDAIVHLAPGPATAAVAAVVRAAYWPAVALLSIAALATIYHVSVPVRTPWHRDLPGAVLAMALWLAGSFGLRFYLETVTQGTSRYGSLAAPIAVLLFFYITALAVLIGAELNAEIDTMWPTAETAEGRERNRSAEERRAAARQRGAVRR